MPGLTEPSLESHSPHELLIVGLPDRLAVLVPSDDRTLHIVGENIPGNTHVLKGMDHANEQILLLGIGEELHIVHLNGGRS